MKFRFRQRHVKLGGTGRVHTKQTRMSGVKEVDVPKTKWRLQ